MRYRQGQGTGGMAGGDDDRHAAFRQRYRDAAPADMPFTFSFATAVPMPPRRTAVIAPGNGHQWTNGCIVPAGAGKCNADANDGSVFHDQNTFACDSSQSCRRHH